MTIKSNEATLIVTGILGGYVAYDIFKRRKLEKALDGLNEHIIVDLDNDELAKYVNRVVSDEVHKAAAKAATDTVATYRNTISASVAAQVNACKSSIAKDVADEISKKVGSLDISSIKRDAVKEAKAEAIKELKKDMDDILDNYKESLDKFSVMYSAVAERTKTQPAALNLSLPTFEFDWTV